MNPKTIGVPGEKLLDYRYALPLLLIWQRASISEIELSSDMDDFD